MASVWRVGRAASGDDGIVSDGEAEPAVSVGLSGAAVVLIELQLMVVAYLELAPESCVSVCV